MQGEANIKKRRPSLRRVAKWVAALGLLIVLGLGLLAWYNVREVDPMPATGAIALRTGGVAEGAARETGSRLAGQNMVRNVTRSTLIPVLPDPDKATGTGVVVAPGGGFFMLSMDTEGMQIARWLADHGIAAFVLKYRVKPTPAGGMGFLKALVAPMSSSKAPQAMNEAYLRSVTPLYAVEDGLAAMKLVREHASEWGVEPDRVGMMGFSAGAITTVAVSQRSTAVTMPAFIAPIYGPMNAMTVPKDAPPLFAAIAADDPFFGDTGYGLAESWRKAGRKVEVHVYQEGGHGYGLGQMGTTTTGWPAAFLAWLKLNEFIDSR